MRATRLPALAGALALLLFGGCETAASACFNEARVTLPDERLVLQAVNNGQSGRDIAAAVFEGDVETVRRLARGDPLLLDTHVPPKVYPEFRPDGQFGDLLTFAVARCDPRMVDALLYLGVPANGMIRGAPLDLAVRAGDLGLARRLLEAGASPDPQKAGGMIVPMLTAGRHARPDAAQLLIRHGADLGWTDSTGTTALQTIVDMDSMRVAEVLIAAGADPWAVGAGGALPARGISEPLQLTARDEEAARQRLIARLNRPGAPWPPPDPATVRGLILDHAWPPTGAREAGLRPAPPEVVAALGGTRH
jgi:hypothetical protein